MIKINEKRPLSVLLYVVTQLCDKKVILIIFLYSYNSNRSNFELKRLNRLTMRFIRDSIS